MRLIPRLFTFGLALLVTACTVNPVTGKKEFTAIGPQQEVAIGEKNYEPYQQQQGGRYVVDADVNAYVNEVGQKLARVSDRPDLPYEFVVVNESGPNAWALPGGKIAITRGLLSILDDEAQLAAVLGHEIVHAAARHTAQQMTQATLLNVGMIAAGVAAQKSDYGQWIAAGAGLGANLWQAKYGRGQELQADEYGIQYMAEAGYDVDAAAELQEKFVQLSKGQSGNKFAGLFASHPPSEERVERNRELAASFNQKGVRNKQSYQRAVAQIKRDQPAYEAHQQALLAARDGDLSKALSLTERAIAKQPKEGLFHLTRGQILFDESPDKAKAAFETAARLNPEHFMGHLGLGLTYRKLNQDQKAEQALSRSMEALATPIAAYHLGELALQAGDRGKARSYFEFAAQGQGELAAAAQAQLGRLGGVP